MPAGTVKPFDFTSLTDNGGDPNYDWNAIHSEWDNGKMNGFYTTNGKTAMGYYKSSDLPYYHSPFPQFTLRPTARRSRFSRQLQ